MKLFLALALFAGAAHGLNPFWSHLLTHGNMMRDPPMREGRQGFEEMRFTQPRDHFNDGDTATYEQRYWRNSENWGGPGYPAFIFIGGEGAASPSWLRYGQWYQMAQENQADMYVLEHRYYGTSYVTEDMSLDNMQWLSSRQALADLKAFIDGMEEENGVTGPWATFGGSYPGSLSAWARLTYPEKIKAAVSSSGPLEAKLDMFEYYETVHDALGTTSNGAECQRRFTEAFDMIEEEMKTQDGLNNVVNLFRGCDYIDIADDLNRWSFGSFLVGVTGGTVQYNEFDAYTIEDVCETMTDPRNGDTGLDAYPILVDEIYGALGCRNTAYNGFLGLLQSTRNNPGSVWRQWYYQTCNEFGWYQTSNQPGEEFGGDNIAPLELSENYCQDAYRGDEWSHSGLEANMDVTNDFYGAKNPDVDHVVFVHGSVDPWHQVGIYESDLNADAPAIYIEGSSHCADMYEDGDSGVPQSPQLTDARAEIRSIIKGWLDEARGV